MSPVQHASTPTLVLRTERTMPGKLYFARRDNAVLAMLTMTVQLRSAVITANAVSQSLFKPVLLVTEA
jgi:hypothetical protein